MIFHNNAFRHSCHYVGLWRSDVIEKKILRIVEQRKDNKVMKSRRQVEFKVLASIDAGVAEKEPGISCRSEAQDVHYWGGDVQTYGV